MDTEFEHVRALRPDTTGPSAAATARQRTVLASAIEAEREPAPARRSHLRSGRRPHAGRRRITPRVLIGVAALVVVSSGSALAWSTFAPDPKDVATVREHAQDHVAVHQPGWRPELDAERVVCDYRSVDVKPSTVYTYASDFPLDEVLTEARLFDECRTNTDAVRPSGIDATPLLCVVTPPGERLPIPIVTFDAASCTNAGLTAPSPTFLDERNRLRRDEVAIRAVPDACPTATQALAWVREQITATGEPLSTKPVEVYAGGRCYLPFVSWGRGEVDIIATLNDSAAPGQQPSTTPDTLVPRVSSAP